LAVVGRVEFKREKAGEWWVGIGIPNWEEGIPPMRYGGALNAIGVKNIAMEQSELHPLLPGFFRVQGSVFGFPRDSFRAIWQALMIIASDTPFDVVVAGRKVAPAVRFWVQPFLPF